MVLYWGFAGPVRRQTLDGYPARYLCYRGSDILCRDCAAEGPGCCYGSRQFRHRRRATARVRCGAAELQFRRPDVLPDHLCRAMGVRRRWHRMPAILPRVTILLC